MITTPWTTGKSRKLIPSYSSRPIPGQANTVSTTTATLIISTRLIPASVSTGINAFLKACLAITIDGGRPFNRASFTYSEPSTSSIDDRVNHNARLAERAGIESKQILRDIESKDYRELINVVHRRLEDDHKDIPNVVKAVVSQHGLSWMSLLAIAFAVQVMVVGAYLVYKKRRGGAPKKYL